MNLGQLKRTTFSLIALLAICVILVAVNVIVGNIRARFDLTEDDLYTLSDGTQNIIGGLGQTVTLYYFFNRNSPQVPVLMKAYAKQVEDLLREYEIRSNGRIRVITYDPEPDSDAEEWAQRFGIAEQPIEMFGPPMYFGLAAICGDNESVLPAFDPRAEELLEYNITRLIHTVAHPEKPTIGVMSMLPVMGFQAPRFTLPGQPQIPPQPAWIAFQELKRSFDVREIPLSADTIDNDIDALVVLHPKRISDETLYALDQFVLRGGRLIAMVDPFCNLDQENLSGQQQFMRQGNNSDLKPLFDAWGVAYEADKVVADPQGSSRIRVGQNRVEDTPIWMTLREQNIQKKDLTTANLGVLMFPLAGGFTNKQTNADLTFTPLVSASKQAGLVNAVMAQFGGEAIRKDFTVAPNQLHVAVRLAGKFKTAFPGGPPKGADKPADGEDEGGDKPPAPPGLAEGESTVILVADADFLFDRFCVEALMFGGARPINDNIYFFANATEVLSGTPDLISIRSRGKFARPFDYVLDLERKARREWQAREDMLTDKLRETQRELDKLQQEKDNTQKFILSPEQQAAIKRFQNEEIRIKLELKEVRKSLRHDIEVLGIIVKAINIAAMPLLVALLGLCFWVYRGMKR